MIKRKYFEIQIPPSRPYYMTTNFASTINYLTHKIESDLTHQINFFIKVNRKIFNGVSCCTASILGPQESLIFSVAEKTEKLEYAMERV